MERAKEKDIQKACEALWALPEKVRPINEEIFLHEDEVIVIKKEVIHTYYRVGKKKLSRLKCARNLRLLEKLL